jgi:hypothetical protein
MGGVTIFDRIVPTSRILGSAGVLTIQQIWDLAPYIDGQCRPGRVCEDDTPAALIGVSGL